MYQAARKSTAKKTLKKMGQGYGCLFEVKKAEASLKRGKRHLEDALKVLECRLPRNASLRQLPISDAERDTLIKSGFAFLMENNDGSYEKDNLSHVQRLVVSIQNYRAPIAEYLGLNYKDLQLLAALHDLGKSLPCDDMLAYLSKIFGEKDFISLRVLPHELYSMVWIQKLGRELNLAHEHIETLMDQISNHNFGPDLSHPANKILTKTNTKGITKHWWLNRWKTWTAKAQRGGVKVSARYGHTVSPLATTLVFFDRVDGGEVESWEKYLNQDLMSGALELSPKAVVQIIRSSSVATQDQILAVGRQIAASFISPDMKIGNFAPYDYALKMHQKNKAIAQRLVDSNRESGFAQYQCSPKTNLLYKTHNNKVFRIDGFTVARDMGRKFIWKQKHWHEADQNVSPVELLMEIIYADRKLLAGQK